MNVFFIGTYKKDPTTGGHLYHLKLVEALRSLRYTVFIISAEGLPGVFKSRYLSFIYPFLIMLKNKPYSVIQISDTALKYILFTIFIDFSSIPIIQMVHHLKETTNAFGIKLRLNRVLIKHNLRKAKGIIVNSEDTKRRIIQLCGELVREKIVIIKPGVDIKFEKREKRDYRKKEKWMLLSVGSVTERKGYVYLIDALNYLNRGKYICYIVGEVQDERYYEKLMDIVKEKKLESNVEFTGYTTEEKLFELYEKSDIFILPSLHEGYGIVLCEAMCQGLAIVATNVGAVSEIVDNSKNGILVAPKSAESIAKAVKRLMNEPGIAEELSENALRRCSELPKWESMIDGVREIIG